MQAAYNSSPFFEYYADDLFAVMNKKHRYLFDFNAELLGLCMDMLGIKADISLTDSYVPSYPEGDFRNTVQPKYKGLSLLEQYKKEKTYFQVFSIKSGFVPNLSILDLISNEGPNASSFLL